MLKTKIVRFITIYAGEHFTSRPSLLSNANFLIPRNQGTQFY
ncbi:MAG: hypothetical protein WC874_04825 [Candidatus Izemoplasmatales bacterium]